MLTLKFFILISALYVHDVCMCVFRWTKWQCDTFVICLTQVNSVPFWRASFVCGSVLQSQSITFRRLSWYLEVCQVVSYMQCKVCELCHNCCFHLLSFLGHYLPLTTWKVEDEWYEYHLPNKVFSITCQLYVYHSGDWVSWSLPASSHSISLILHPGQISQKTLLLRLYGTLQKHLFHARTIFLIQETLLSGQVKKNYCDLRVVIYIIYLIIYLFIFFGFALPNPISRW